MEEKICFRCGKGIDTSKEDWYEIVLKEKGEVSSVVYFHKDCYKKFHRDKFESVYKEKMDKVMPILKKSLSKLNIGKKEDEGGVVQYV